MRLSRRWLVACYVVFTGYALAMVFTGGNDGAWARWAVGGYALAGLAAWLWRRRAPALLIALAGGLVAPTVWLVLRAPATPDVAVVSQSARLLLRHGSPYLPAAQLTTVLSYNPYLPGMAIFGLPGAAGLPGLLGDTRPWLIVVSLAALAGSFRVAGQRPSPTLTAVFGVGSPVLALSLAVGITDAPVIALVCLALGCLTARRDLTIAAGLAVGAACALKFTAWPALPVIAAMLAVRDGARGALRFTVAGVVTTAAVVAAFAPALVTHPGALAANVILFPLGLTRHKTPAASPVPGHLLAAIGPAGHLAAIALLGAAAVGVAVSLVVRPPRTVPAAALRLAIGLALLFALAPASRFGYFAYPIALLAWPVLARSASVAWTSGGRPSPAAAPSAPGVSSPRRSAPRPR